MRNLLLIIMILACCLAQAATIADQLLAVNEAKQDIKTAAEAKGVTIGSAPLADYADIIADIPYASGAKILSTAYLATDTAKGSIVTVIASDSAYLATKHTNPVVNFDSNVLFFGFTNALGTMGQNIPITVIWWRNAVAGDLD